MAFSARIRGSRADYMEKAILIGRAPEPGPEATHSVTPTETDLWAHEGHLHPRSGWTSPSLRARRRLIRD